MPEEIRKESVDMATAIETAREAEALSILRMLDKAIAEGEDIKLFRAKLDAYIEGRQKK